MPCALDCASTACRYSIVPNGSAKRGQERNVRSEVAPDRCWSVDSQEKVKIVATRCYILRLKCTKFDFRWGFAPDPTGGVHSAPPDSLAAFKGSYV